MNKRFALGFTFTFALILVVIMSSSTVFAETPKAADTIMFSAIDKDTDGDGLSDYWETYKYFTDPNKKDTDGDGLLDGNMAERREYTYSISIRVKMIKPWNTEYMTDDYQDLIDIVEETDKTITVDLVIYPLTTNHTSITPNYDWKAQNAANPKLVSWLKPGRTTNWDVKLRNDLLAELKSVGIDPNKLSDAELVTRVTNWIMQGTKSKATWALYFLDFSGDSIKFIDENFGMFYAKENGYTSAQQLIENDMMGKSMYYNKTRGACSSSATYIATIFRALGIPTRLISTYPIADAVDAQLNMVDSAITNYQIKNTMMEGLYRGAASISNHKLVEVYVGNRWYRLNYDKLGNNVLDLDYFGLSFKNATFQDYSDYTFWNSIGKRFVGIFDVTLSSDNAFMLLSISESYGKNNTRSYKQTELITKGEVLAVYTYNDKSVSRDSQNAMKNLSSLDNNPFFLVVQVSTGKAWRSFEEMKYQRFFNTLQKIGNNIIMTAPDGSQIRGDLCWNSMGITNNYAAGVVINPDDIKVVKKNVEYVITFKVNPIFNLFSKIPLKVTFKE